MKRAAFIKNLLTLGAFAYLPKAIAKQYTKYYLLQCFVAGFRYYKGIKLLNELNEGDLLALVREPDNEFDKRAIALMWNEHKIGFIPQRENKMLSKLMDTKALELVAEITHLNKQTESWENVRIAIHFLKDSDNGLSNAEYLTVLYTPNYTTYKLPENEIRKINVNSAVDNIDSNWYAILEDNSANDGIYDIIHSSNVQCDYRYGKDTGEYFIVNKNKLPKDEKIAEVIAASEQELGELNELFDQDGFIVLAVEEVEKLVPKLTAIVDVPDKLGRHFIELVF